MADERRLLAVSTGSGSQVHLWGDAVLYEPPVQYGHRYSYTPRITQPGRIFAMSIVGPEQAIRAIAAGCALEHLHERTTLRFRGHTGDEISARWGPGWSCRAQQITQGAMHLVAMPKVTVAKDVVGEVDEHLIIPNGDLGRALYERLLLAYSTPLLPLDMPGQPPHERAASYEWCAVITAAILQDETCWTELQSHPDQPDKTWHGAGLLRMPNEELDGLVGALVRSRHLTIPEKAA